MCKCTAYLPAGGSPCLSTYCIYFMFLRKSTVIYQSAVGGKQSHRHKYRSAIFIEVLSLKHTSPQFKYRTTCRLPILALCCSVASTPPLLPDFPAKWQLVSPWTGSWYQPESAARLINLIDLQWLENKLFEQLCLSDHISLPESQKAPSLWWTSLRVFFCFFF